MLYVEFNQKMRELGYDADITNEDYQIIEKVYTYHPSIPDIDGKSIIAKLFLLGGMTLMNDMYVRAAMIETYDEEIATKERELAVMKENMEGLKVDIIPVRSGWQYEYFEVAREDH